MTNLTCLLILNRPVPKGSFIVKKLEFRIEANQLILELLWQFWALPLTQSIDGPFPKTQLWSNKITTRTKSYHSRIVTFLQLTCSKSQSCSTFRTHPSPSLFHSKTDP